MLRVLLLFKRCLLSLNQQSTPILFALPILICIKCQARVLHQITAFEADSRSLCRYESYAGGAARPADT